MALFLLDDRLPSEPSGGSSRWDIPWRGIVVLVVILGLCIVGSMVAPAEGLACVVLATVIALRFLVRLGDWQGMKDHHQ
jgi:hypothetical protein